LRWPELLGRRPAVRAWAADDKRVGCRQRGLGRPAARAWVAGGESTLELELEKVWEEKKNKIKTK
jgi:hypothetical protein